MSLLANLFNLDSKDIFLSEYKNNRPLFTSDNDGQLSELAQLPIFQSLENLFDWWPSNINAYLPGLADEANSTSASVNEAREIFNGGRTLFFDDINHHEPLVDKWLQIFKEEFGLSCLTYGRGLIYALKEGGKTDAHFDQNINLILQLKGEKRWDIAPNEHVVNPLTRHTIGTEIDPELASYTEREMPKVFPKEYREFILRPGSLLFLPRGLWHRTESLSDSLALNFTFSAPSWIDLLTSALRGRLAQSSNWRESANFVNDPKRYSQALAEFDELIEELKKDLPSWRAEDILKATEF